MSEATLSQRLAEFASATTFSTLPDEVINSVRGRILDTLGICIAATQLPTSRAAMGWVAYQGGVAEATAFGLPEKVPATGAAFVNGVLAHSLDYDDTHLPSVLHPSASTVPAALAAAEANNANGEETTVAIALGIEIAVRLGMAGYDRQAGNSTFFEHGQHATSITGAMGAAVAAGKLYGLDAAGIANVLGVTASMASGIIESNRTGGTVKRLHCGWAAQSAVSAAQLVARGFTGPPTVLEGRFGFFEAWLHGAYSPEEITKELGTQWSVPDIFFKPYPANHFTHAAIDAALELRSEGLTPDNIAHIEVGAATAPARTIGEPIEVKRRPESGYMAQFSAPFVVAAALTGGGGLGLGLDDFTDERAADPKLCALMDKVDVVTNEECDGIFPHQFPAIVRATTLDGTIMVKKILTNRGGPDRPLSFPELASKFDDNASRVITSHASEQIRTAIAKFEKLPDLSQALEVGRQIAPISQ